MGVPSHFLDGKKPSKVSQGEAQYGGILLFLLGGLMR